MQSSPFQFGQQPQATVTPQPQQGGGTVFGGGFGTGGGLFSQQSNPAAGSQPSFANFGVATSTTTAPQSGGGTPSFGTFGSGNTISFGTPTAAGANPFGFGKPQQASTPFGGGVAPTPAFGFGLGSSTSTSTPAAPLGGGGGLFGAATPQATSIFGATQPQQQQPPATNVSFGFGTGQQQAAPQGSLFGGFGQAQAPQQQQQKPLFNLSGLGGGGGATGAGVGPTFGASGSGFNFGQFQQNQQHQQQPSQQQLLLQQMMMNEQAYIHHSIFDCQKFGDIRDSTLSMLNFLLSCWGIGEGHFAPHHPPIPYSNQNILYLFKAVGYSYFYTDSNEDGQVILHLKRPLIAPASPEENEFLSSLQTIVGGPNIIFRISGRKALPQESCQIILIADDRSTLRRILATELAQVLAQPQIKPQLDRLGVVGISPKVKPSPQQLKAYFENPPGGMDPRIWMKAIEDNPDPQNMIPVPIVGAEALKQRLEAQEKESLQHEERLKMIGNEVASLANRHVNLSAELQQMRRRFSFLSHRIVATVLRLLMMEMKALPVQPEEEALGKQLGFLQKELNSSKELRGRLTLLVESVTAQRPGGEYRGDGGAGGRTKNRVLDLAAIQEVTERLTVQQESIHHLVESVKGDAQVVKKMDETVSQFNLTGEWK